MASTPRIAIPLSLQITTVGSIQWKMLTNQADRPKVINNPVKVTIPTPNWTALLTGVDFPDATMTNAVAAAAPISANVNVCDTVLSAKSNVA
jgi:hypothetical protein